MHDITKLKQAEEAMRESEKNFRTVVKNANDGLIIASSTGAHLYANRRASEITGYSVEELLTIRMDELAYPDEIPKLFETLKKRINGEEISRQYETVIVQKEGKTVPIEITGAKTFWQDQVADIVIFRDISESKRANELLRESEEKYRNLFNNAEVGMFRTRLDGSEILDLNDKFLDICGRTREEVQGSPSVIHWPDPSEREEIVCRLELEGHVLDFECEMLNKQGEVRTCLTSLVLYREQGILEGSIIDITERK